MAAGREVLKVLEEEKLQENALNMGNLLLKGMKELQSKYEKVGDVRGQGLMLGMEIVKNKETKEPDTPFLLKVYEKTKDYGMLVGKGGRFGNVFRIKPPMCINAKDVEFALDVFDRSIKESL